MQAFLNLSAGPRLSPVACQQRRSAAACKPRSGAAASLRARRSRRAETTCSAAPQAPPASPLAGVQSEEQLFAILKGAVAAGKIPERLLVAMEDLYQNYKSAVLGSGVEGADEKYVAKARAPSLGCQGGVRSRKRRKGVKGRGCEGQLVRSAPLEGRRQV
jgi:hypothetical protein